MKRFVAPCALAIGLALSLTACTDPYSPGQRAVGGGLLGAGAGAAIGGIAGGGSGAVVGAPIPAAQLSASAAALQPLLIGEHTDRRPHGGRLGSEQAAECREFRQYLG
jgi:hypothetical protein